MAILRSITRALLQGAIFGRKVFDPEKDGFGETVQPSQREIAQEITKDLHELLTNRYKLQVSYVSVRWVGGERGFIGMVYLQGCSAASWGDLFHIEQRLCFLLNGMGYEVRGLFFSTSFSK